MSQNEETASTSVRGSNRVKHGIVEILKGGVIVDVVNVGQARIAEDTGAMAVMGLEHVPADIHAQCGVSRRSDPDMIETIIAAVADPGHNEGPDRPLRRGAGHSDPRCG